MKSEKKIIDLFSRTSPNKELEAIFHEWLLDPAAKDEKDAALKEVWKETEQNPDISTLDSLKKVYAKSNLKFPGQNRQGVGVFVRAVLIAAAVAVAVIPTYLLTKDKYGNVSMLEANTSAMESETVNLPDGTVAQLNSESILLYPEHFVNDTRVVYLIGEGNFKVAKDSRHPFIVRSGEVSIKALGTEFNMTAYPDENEVTASLLEGKVKVCCNEGVNEYILSPGQKVRYLKDTHESYVEDVDIEVATDWQRGELLFRSSTLQEILSRIERKYGIRFISDQIGLGEDRYTVRFPDGCTFESIISILSEITCLDFEYVGEERICYLRKK